LPRRGGGRRARQPARVRGHKVIREYYVNDAGAQVDVLARSAHVRYREALGEAVGEIPEGLYPGDYLSRRPGARRRVRRLLTPRRPRANGSSLPHPRSRRCWS
jgi:vacuolar-type H+-ATPase catalytic subunit A/Vma1